MGIVTFPRTPEEYIGFAKSNGFAHLEVDMFKHFLDSFDSNRISNLKEMASSNSITLSVHAPYTLNLAERFPEIREAYLNYYKKLVEFTASLGGRWLTLHMGYHIGFSGGKERAVKRAIDSFRLILESAKGLGVVLAVENVNPMPLEGELFYIGDNLNEIRTILENLDSDLVKFCLDVGHAHTAEGPQEYISLFRDKLVNVHIHDNQGIEDEHLPVGKGTIDWKRVLRHLKNANYNGPLNLEIYEDEEKIKSKNYIYPLLHEF